jgi:hypothetical protein
MAVYARVLSIKMREKVFYVSVVYNSQVAPVYTPGQFPNSLCIFLRFGMD